MILSSRNDDKWFQGRTVFLQDGGREGGGGMRNYLLQERMTSLQTFFSYPITFANNLFGLFKPCKQFFSIFLICPLQRKNSPSLIWVKYQPCSYIKAFHKFLEIFQKSSRNFLKSCPKSARKNKIIFDLIVKYTNCRKKGKISRHFCAILRRNLLCPYRTKNCNEPIKLLDDLPHSRQSSKSVECESSSTILNFP